MNGLRCCVLALVLLVSGGASAQHAEDPDWPCIQRLVPEVSAGMVWAGPSVEGIANGWQEDAEVRDLVRELASRRIPLEQATAAIEPFSEGIENEKNIRLTNLFSGILDTINQERNKIIAGIKRYSIRQRKLADKISGLAAELAENPDDGTAEQQARRKLLEEKHHWDMRVFEDRQNSLTYICEQPILLEQRVFALAREIMVHLDE